MSKEFNRWTLTEEVKEKYKPIIQEWLTKMENLTVEEVETADNEIFHLELSDTELRPYTLLELLKEDFMYDDEDFDDNGWELDYWIRIRRNGVMFPSTCERLCIHGCGMTFELNLSVNEAM